MKLSLILCLLTFSACAGLGTLPVNQSPRPVYSAPRTVRVIGTIEDMQRAGEQYCGGQYMLEFTGFDHTEGLVTCT
jgi:hypothetical protein